MQLKSSSIGPMLAMLRSKVFTGATLLLVLLLGYAFERFKEYFPVLVTMQLKTNALVSRFEARKPRVNWVTTVVIDDQTYWTYLGGVSPINRQFLAEVVLAAADADPAVVAIDIDLTALDPSKPGDVEPRRPANGALLQAIRQASEMPRSLPIVLACGLSRKNGNWTREAGIWEDNKLPRGPTVGYINLPIDRRQIPLVTAAVDWEGNSAQDLRSFALQTVNAYETAMHIRPEERTVNNGGIERAVDHDEFVYGSFLPPSEFTEVSALRVFKRDPDALALLRHRIVIIGGNPHKELGSTELMDSYESPVGQMAGMYFHANYIEALLDNRTKAPAPAWLAVAVDLGLGVLMIYLFRRARRTVMKLAILGLFFIPLLLAYFVSVNLSLCLDFLIALIILPLHLATEHYLEIRHLARAGKEVFEHALH